jgi:hypothetical protein
MFLSRQDLREPGNGDRVVDTGEKTTTGRRIAIWLPVVIPGTDRCNRFSHQVECTLEV